VLTPALETRNLLSSLSWSLLGPPKIHISGSPTPPSRPAAERELHEQQCLKIALSSLKGQLHIHKVASTYLSLNDGLSENSNGIRPVSTTAHIMYGPN
jgi:hypothetical protein